MEKAFVKKTFDYSGHDTATRIFLQTRAKSGKALLQQTAQGVWSMGKLLAEAKERLPHGDFGKWIDAEFGLTIRSAQRFMSVYDHFKSDTMSHLTATPTVLYLLAAPSVSEETRANGLALIESGELSTTGDAKAFLAAANESERVRVAVEIGKFVHLFHTCGTRLDHPDASKLPEYSEEDLIDVFQLDSSSRKKGLYAWENFFEIYGRYEFLQQDWSAGSEAEARYGVMSEGRHAFETNQLHELCREAWTLTPQEQLWPRVQNLIQQMREVG